MPKGCSGLWPNTPIFILWFIAWLIAHSSSCILQSLTLLYFNSPLKSQWLQGLIVIYIPFRTVLPQLLGADESHRDSYKNPVWSLLDSIHGPEITWHMQNVSISASLSTDPSLNFLLSTWGEGGIQQQSPEVKPWMSTVLKEPGNISLNS